jgi:hypothetical protein
MAIQSSNNNVAYGLNNALQNLAALPILAKRAPAVGDLGQIGQQWIYNNMIWELTSSGTWSQLAIQQESPTFSGLTVNGVSTLNGDTTIGNFTAATYVEIEGGSTGGIALTTGGTGSSGTGDILLVSHKVSVSGTYNATNNALIGTVTITGGTLGQGDSGNIVITNSNITTLSTVLITVVNNNVSGHDALITANGTILTANTMSINITNDGGADGLATTDSIMVSFIILG